MDTSTESGLDDLAASVRAARLPEPEERRRIREGARVTVREGAAVCGVSKQTFLDWETAKTEPRRAHAIVYRQLLDTLKAAQR